MESNAELIRENKYLSARNDYGLNARLGYPRIMDETDPLTRLSDLRNKSFFKRIGRFFKRIFGGKK